MFTFKQIENAIEANVVLSDGTIAGTGYAGTMKNAAYFAAKDATQSGNARFEQAGRGHLRQVEGL